MAFIRVLFVFLLPPVAVYLQRGWGRELAINVVLTILGFFPGMLHAVYLLTARPPGLIRRDRMEPDRREPEHSASPSRQPPPL